MAGLISQKITGLRHRAALLFLAAVLLAAMPAAAVAADTAGTPPAGTIDYVLGTGDKLRVTVFGEPELSGEFEIASSGELSMPLVGNLVAAKKTVPELQRELTTILSSGYLRDPRVSIEVLNYRPFFILGEVMKPGSYPYVNGMTVISAVALAGGYTYRADQKDIQLKRGEQSEESRVDEATPVQAGDIIRVPERFF